MSNERSHQTGSELKAWEDWDDWDDTQSTEIPLSPAEFEIQKEEIRKLFLYSTTLRKLKKHYNPRNNRRHIYLTFHHFSLGPGEIEPGVIADVPKVAEQLLYLLLPKSSREPLAGDLEEEFLTVILPKFGPRYARRWYWFQVLRSIGPIVRGFFTRWVSIGALGQWLLRKLGM